MKPSDFLFPGFGPPTTPLFHDQMLFIPKFYVHKTENNELHTYDYFCDHKNDCHVEFCSGNGSWIAEKAIKNPHCNWIAVEIKLSRARQVWSKIKNYNLSNLIVVCGDAKTLVKFYKLPKISSIYINFPDPWPKQKHAKHRIIQHDFINDCAKILKHKGDITLVTDDINFLTWSINILLRSDLDPMYKDPFFVTRNDEYGLSWFEKLWRDRNKEINYTTFASV